MNSNRLPWFIVLSVAVHAVVLLAWTRPELEAGNPGRIIRLDMVEVVGTMTAAAAPRAMKASEPATPATNTLAKTTDTTIIPPAGIPETGDTEEGDSAATSTPAEQRERSPAVAASSPRPSREEADRHLRNSILELVATHLEYPPLARRKGWQGVVVLQLRIESDGRISQLQVNETSGYPVLDRAAVVSLQLASVTQAGVWLDDEAVDIVVPIEYRLVDS